MALVAVASQWSPQRRLDQPRDWGWRNAMVRVDSRRLRGARAAMSVKISSSPCSSRRRAEWEFDPLGICEPANGNFVAAWGDLCVVAMKAIGNKQTSGKQSTGKGIAAAIEDSSIDFGDFFRGKLPGKFLLLLGWLALSRVGTYIPLPGVDRAAFSGSMTDNSLFRTLDAFSGGGIGRLGVCSLGIVPFINAQILFQLLGSLFPELERLQKKEGEAGRKKVLQYTRYASVAFAIFQAIGQVLYIRPYADDFSLGWIFTSISLLTIGAVLTSYIGERISDIKLGNGTSLLIFTNIISSLPASVGRTIDQALKDANYAGLGTIGLSFFLLVLGIVYVQESERRIPLNYASRYSGGLQKSAYLPFKINSSGVMPIIFSTSALALTSSVARFSGATGFNNIVATLNPGGSFYLPTNAVLIAFFNYFYTFLQLDPSDVSDQLKRQGASIPSVRPGKATAAFIETVLTRISVLDSTFLVIMAVSPAAVEWLTHLTAFRGFAGTSILILVGCATDTARKVKAELISQKYRVLDFTSDT
ncbi:preprotein translocase subunit SCY1, chloroplastic isoform X1 [Selaginella moellendorffii]|nr:preprotein translocase subunit SCY1, chloroplastic isoform X1 [Selaginella moellendorffii]|eukprot:XP_002993375.2 preprotein translocase subunit SCY1, chloroplastic isoform X1 [Selaginella moellendorffii]